MAINPKDEQRLRWRNGPDHAAAVMHIGVEMPLGEQYKSLADEPLPTDLKVLLKQLDKLKS